MSLKKYLGSPLHCNHKVMPQRGRCNKTCRTEQALIGAYVCVSRVVGSLLTRSCGELMLHELFVLFPTESTALDSPACVCVRACVCTRVPTCVLQRQSLTRSYQISLQNSWGNLGLALPDHWYSYNK